MKQLLDVWNGLSAARKVIAIGATVGMFVAVLAMTRMVAAPSMTLLYAGLEPNAAGEIVRSLEARGVAFDVRGGSIFVDSGQRDQLRMTLASEGLPSNTSGGYELLDNLSGFGTTSQMFDAAYWRAKEGELARTIVASPQINSARVHIANGGSSPFQRQITPSASVAVTAIGNDLSREQAKALRYLVASAVSGLAPEDVTVINSNGTLVDFSEPSDTGSTNSSSSEEIKEKVERLLEARVGPGNAIVAVSVDTVTEREAIRERTFDPESRVAISTDTEEVTSSSSQAPLGQVTVASNLPDGDAEGGEGTNSENNQTRERVNYEVSETEREIVKVPGAIKRLTVAVLVNAVESIQADGTTTVEPRADEEMAALKELVESAVGYDETRGDVITLKSMGLLAIEPAGTQVSSSLFDGLALDMMSVIQMAVLALVTLILGLFVVRPVISGALRQNETLSLSTDPIEQDNQSGAANLPLSEMADDTTLDPDGFPQLAMASGFNSDLPDLPMMGTGSGESPADRLRNMIQDRQTETVEILRGWLEDTEEPV